jgi:hypothetical protein
MELTEQTRNSPEFSNKEIRAALKENPNNQKKYMLHLQQYGYIQKASGDQKKGYLYVITSYEEYYQLQHRIRNAMDEVISKFRNTNHIERKNLSLRTHLKRLNRRTICFSKSLVILSACLRIYFWSRVSAMQSPEGDSWHYKTKTL